MGHNCKIDVENPRLDRFPSNNQGSSTSFRVCYRAIVMQSSKTATTHDSRSGWEPLPNEPLGPMTFQTWYNRRGYMDLSENGGYVYIYTYVCTYYNSIYYVLYTSHNIIYWILYTYFNMCYYYWYYLFFKIILLLYWIPGISWKLSAWWMQQTAKRQFKASTNLRFKRGYPLVNVHKNMENHYFIVG